MTLLAHTGIDHVAIGVGAAVVIAVYGLAWAGQRRPNRRRLASWVAGVVIVVVASSPWLEVLAEESFTGHMVQHLLVIIVAAPLLVLARPVQTVGGAGWLPVASSAAPAGRRWAAAWRTWAPIAGPLFFVAVLYVTHLTAIYDRALDDRLVHEVEHAAYLVGAVLTWSAVLGSGRSSAAARVGAVFGVAAGGALLGMVLLSAPTPLIPTYEEQLGTARALSDQRSAAALMWVGGMLTTVPLLLIAVWRWASTEERIARRAEALRPPPHPDPSVGGHPSAGGARSDPAALG
jgi:putative membrane protein